jgi:hypothetical protein
MLFQLFKEIIENKDSRGLLLVKATEANLTRKQSTHQPTYICMWPALFAAQTLDHLPIQMPRNDADK